MPSSAHPSSSPCCHLHPAPLDITATSSTHARSPTHTPFHALASCFAFSLSIQFVLPGLADVAAAVGHCLRWGPRHEAAASYWRSVSSSTSRLNSSADRDVHGGRGDRLLGEGWEEEEEGEEEGESNVETGRRLCLLIFVDGCVGDGRLSGVQDDIPDAYHRFKVEPSPPRPSPSSSPSSTTSSSLSTSSAAASSRSFLSALQSVL